MKKIIYLFVIVFVSTFISCDTEEDDDSGLDDVTTNSGSVTLGDETYVLQSGFAEYEGKYGEEDYYIDLRIFTLSKEKLEQYDNIDYNGLTEEEANAAESAILGDETLAGFFIDGYSDIAEILSTGTYEKSESNKAFTYEDASFYTDIDDDDTEHVLSGELKVIDSSKDYYEIEFSGTTADGTDFSMKFKGDLIYQDDSND